MQSISLQQLAECFSQSWEAIQVCKMKISQTRSQTSMPSFTLPVRAQQLANLTDAILSKSLNAPFPSYFHRPCFLFHSDLCINLLTSPPVPVFFLTQNTFPRTPQITILPLSRAKISNFTKRSHTSLSQDAKLRPQPSFQPDSFHKYLFGSTPLSQTLGQIVTKE